MRDWKQTAATTADLRWRCVAALVAYGLSAASVGASPARAQGQPASSGSGKSGDAVITVTVTHPVQDGEVACALFATPEGFPDAASKSRGVVHPAKGTSATCTFDGVAPGTYAVAVLLDTNGNGTTDTNFFGRPTEPWGVSNDARPAMRAPKFEEASFTVAAGGKVTVAVELK